MKQLLSLGGLIGGITCIITSASAQPAPCVAGITEGMFCQDRHAKVIAARIVLPGPTSWDFESFTIPTGTIIETDGHELRLKAVDLVVEGSGEATIRAFSDTDVPNPPPKAGSGREGEDFVRGPDSEGRCRRCDGRPGGTGGFGGTGAPGNRGRHAGLVLIEVTKMAEGELVIANRGGRGGVGGEGGDGGPGGDGEQGGRAQAKNEVDCGASPPHGSAAHGGPGGSGGNGGSGGPGGPGGNGGSITLHLPAKAALQIETDVRGGEGGEGGAPGRGGAGGDPGYGGKGDGWRLPRAINIIPCQDEFATRQGSKGELGRPRNDQERRDMGGPKGPDGAKGMVVRF